MIASLHIFRGQKQVETNKLLQRTAKQNSVVWTQSFQLFSPSLSPIPIRRGAQTLWMKKMHCIVAIYNLKSFGIFFFISIALAKKNLFLSASYSTRCDYKTGEKKHLNFPTISTCHLCSRTQHSTLHTFALLEISSSILFSFVAAVFPISVSHIFHRFSFESFETQ